MAFSEFERALCEHDLMNFMRRRRPPPHIRPKLDLGYRIERQSITLFEIRPSWRDAPRTIEEAVAKLTLVRTRNVWRIYWMRADMKWYAYPPRPEVRTLEAALAVVDRDELSCFFG